MGVLFFLTNNKNLKEICVGSLGLEKGSLGLLDTRWQRELDFGVVHLLNKRSAGLASFNGLNTDNFAGSFLEFPQLTQEIPKSRFGDNRVWSENSHTVQRSLGFILRWQFTANNLKFTEWSLGLHFYLEL